MAFGSPTGPPASAKDVARLAELLAAAGFESFKEARHPIGLTQRQAGGKFTRDEVAELIERLETGGEGAALDGSPPPERGAPARRPVRRREEQALSVAGVPDELLVGELELRGWTCIAPTRDR
jgi:hypothetical protein